MIVRDAIATDAPIIAAIIRRSIIELCTEDHQNNPAVLEKWLSNKSNETITSWLTTSGNSTVVAIDGSTVVAVGLVTRDGEIKLNYVSPSARFSGASKAILRSLEDRARTQGNSLCRLTSTKTALQFYKSAGYIEEPGTTADREAQEHLMLKALTPQNSNRPTTPD